MKKDGQRWHFATCYLLPANYYLLPALTPHRFRLWTSVTVRSVEAAPPFVQHPI
ncbi:MAG: hypothetical protein LBK25_00385 [Treponema sp.]|nr:hypothetical protein [Treponema sp.]